LRAKLVNKVVKKVTDPIIQLTLLSIITYLEKFFFDKNDKKAKANQKTEILFIERCVDFLKPGVG